MVMALCGGFGYWSFRCKDQNQIFSTKFSCTSVRFSTDNFFERSETCNNGEARLRITRWHDFSNIFENIASFSILCRSQSHWFFKWIHHFIVLSSIGTLIEQTETLVPEIMNLKIDRNKQRHFLEFSDYQSPDAKIKIPGVSIKFSSTVVGFSIGILMEEVKLVVPEKLKIGYRDKSKIISFFKFYGTSGLWRKSKKHALFKEIVL